MLCIIRRKIPKTLFDETLRHTVKIKSGTSPEVWWVWMWSNGVLKSEMIHPFWSRVVPGPCPKNLDCRVLFFEKLLVLTHFNQIKTQVFYIVGKLRISTFGWWKEQILVFHPVKCKIFVHSSWQCVLTKFLLDCLWLNFPPATLLSKSQSQLWEKNICWHFLTS